MHFVKKQVVGHAIHLVQTYWIVRMYGASPSLTFSSATICAALLFFAHYLAMHIKSAP